MDKIMDDFGLFDYIETSEGTYEYTAAEITSYFAGMVGNGVLKGAGTQFHATAVGLQITIGNGEAWLLGQHGKTNGNTILTIDPVVEGMQKICSIVLDVDKVNQLMGISVVAGTQSESPSAPQLSTTETRYQQLLWSALVHDDGTITLTDARTYVARPGDSVTPSDMGAVAFSETQTLTDEQKAQARANTNSEAKRLQFTDVVVDDAAFAADTTYTAFPYRAAVALTGVVASMVPHVVFGVDDAVSGIFAPVAECYDGGVYLYASAVPAADITIPTIICWPEVS